MSKRMFDVVVICLAAVAWVPIVAFSALAVLVFSGRPIFYRSSRWVGAKHSIEMLKLRVMVPGADQRPDVAAQDGFLNTIPGSALYTPVGRVLDKLGLNEIPQLLHVLKGDMTIVGPRPLTDAVRGSLVDAHGLHIARRWAGTPSGLTGLPQLVGRSSLTDVQRIELETAYAQMVSFRYSPWVDFKILLMTVLITFGLRSAITPEAALRLIRVRTSYEVAGLPAVTRSAAPEADVA